MDSEERKNMDRHDYMRELVNEHGYNLKTIEEVEEKGIEPLDFVKIDSWEDISILGGAKNRADEEFLGLEYIKCTYNEGLDVELGHSVVAVIPYNISNDTPYWKMKDDLVRMWRELEERE